jgi:hypothetical protein
MSEQLRIPFGVRRIHRICQTVGTVNPSWDTTHTPIETIFSRQCSRHVHIFMGHDQ